MSDPIAVGNAIRVYALASISTAVAAWLKNGDHFDGFTRADGERIEAAMRALTPLPDPRAFLEADDLLVARGKEPDA